jgi:hypothetical protein
MAGTEVLAFGGASTVAEVDSRYFSGYVKPANLKVRPR